MAEARKLSVGRGPLPGLLVGVVLVAVVLATYWPSLDNGFVFDDDQYLTENPHVQVGITSDSIRWAFTTTYASNWHPLTWLSHMLDWQLYGSNASGHHLSNVLLHAANSVLLLILLIRMTGSLWRSAFAAYAFALHPLHVESVAWISERKDVLSALLWMLTTLAYVWYARKPGIWRYLPVLVLYALGLMAKPMLVTLPLVLLMLDWWPLGRVRNPAPVHPSTTGTNGVKAVRASPALALAEKLPLFALAAASCVITVIAQQRGGSLIQTEAIPPAERAANAVVSYAAYLLKTVWPAGLAAYYPHPGPTIPGWQIAVSAVLILAITAWAIRFRATKPYGFVGWLWYLLTLVPVIGVIQVGNQAMADRYTYIPLIGIFIIIAWGIPDLLDRAAPLNRKSYRTAALAAAACAALVGMSMVSRFQVGYWKDDLTLFSRALQVTHANWLAHCRVARALEDRGDLDGAARHFRQAAHIKPRYAGAHAGLATVLTKQGDYQEAIRWFSSAIQLNPGDSMTRTNYGTALDRLGRTASAIRQWQLAVKLDPLNHVAHGNLGSALARTGNYSAAVHHLEEACRLTKYADPWTMAVLAEAYHRAGQRDDAIATAGRAAEAAESAGAAEFAGRMRARMRFYGSRR